MKIGYKSDVGKKRELNEDSIVIVRCDTACESENVQAALLIVADGMGGHNAGEVASRLASTRVAENVVKSMLEQGSIDLGKTIKEVNKDIYEYVEENPEYKDMGTTVTAAVVQGPHVYIGHVGDTRAYLISEEIIQITKDHSLVQEIVDHKEITKEEARIHPQKHIITRAVGIHHTVEVDTVTKYLYGDDYLLLCSDGLTDIVTDEEICNIIRVHADPQTICDALVDTANDRGGFDNISVIVAQVDGLPRREDILSDKTRIRMSRNTEEDDRGGE